MPYRAPPWHIDDEHPDCDGYAVVLDETGEVVEGGCYSNFEDAQAHLAALYANVEESMSREIIPADQAKIAVPARVLNFTNADDDELMDLIRNGHALDPDVLDDHPPVFFAAEISSTSLDAYHTWMSPSTLQNYRDDAEEGVSVQDAHETDSTDRTIGRSLRAVLEDIEGPRERARAQTMIPEDLQHQRVVSDFYVLNGVGHDRVIQKLRAGVLRDVSVGFYGGSWTCDICGGNYLSWLDCSHLAGVDYIVEDEESDEKRVVVATVRIDDANLSEYSLVYDGATPGAMIEKARTMAEAGMVKPTMARTLEARYRIDLPQVRRVWAGVDWPANAEEAAQRLERITQLSTNLDWFDATPPAGFPSIAGEEVQERAKKLNAVDTAPSGAGRNHMANENEARLAAYQFIRSYLADRGLIDGDGPDAVKTGVRALVATVAAGRQALRDVGSVGDVDLTEADFDAGVEALAGEIERLRPLADDGETYREDLVEEAIRAGIRARGEDFDEETYRNMLEGAEIPVIKRLRDDWRDIGDQRFPGGRSTVEGEDAPAEDGDQDEDADRDIPADAVSNA